MKREITFYRKESYGQVRYYPESRIAKLLCMIAGTKTFTEQTLNVIKDLSDELDLDFYEVLPGPAAELMEALRPRKEGDKS